MIGTLSREASQEFLKSGIIGRIGCHDGSRTYIVPVQYVYDGKDIYCHSVEGMKIHMMRKNPSVCFEADEIKTVNNWKSVIVWGTYEELKGEYARYNTLRLFAGRFLQFKVSETAFLPLIDGDNSFRSSHIRPVMYRIIVEEISGRFENTLPGMASAGN